MRSSNILIFSAGLGLGALFGWIATKNHYAELAEIDMQETRDYYYEKLDELEAATNRELKKKAEDKLKPDTTKVSYNYDKPDIMSFYQTKAQLEAEAKESEEESKEMNIKDYEDRPTIISPSEFVTDDEFSKSTVTLYSNNVLVDEDDEVLDIDETIGRDNATIIDDDTDTLYVRNFRLNTDYEVITDPSEYEE